MVNTSQSQAAELILPDLPLIRVFNYLKLVHLKDIRMVNKRWNDLVRPQFENEANVMIERCIIDSKCPPWSILKNATFNIKNVTLNADLVRKSKTNEFWKDIGENIENFTLISEDGMFSNMKVLLNFPKLKSISISWDFLLELELPQSIESIVVDKAPTILGAKDFRKFDIKIAKMKNLKEVIAKNIDEITPIKSRIKKIQFIKIPIKHDGFKQYHPVNILEMKNLNYSHIRGIRLSKKYKKHLPHLHNLKNLYLMVKENGCFFIHDYIKLDAVEFVYLRAPDEEKEGYWEEGERANLDSDADMESESDDGSDDEDDSLSSDDQNNQETHSESSEDINIGDLVQVPSKMSVDCTEKSSQNSSIQDLDSTGSFSDADNMSFIHEENYMETTYNSEFDFDDFLAKPFTYCDTCISNLFLSCPNITKWSLKSSLINLEDMVKATPKPITFLSMKQIQCINDNFWFKLKHLVELKINIKWVLVNASIDDDTFVEMPNLKKLSIVLDEFWDLSYDDLNVILNKCPAVEEAEFNQLSVKQILLIEEKWPNLKVLMFNCENDFDIKKLIDELKGNFTSLRKIDYHCEEKSQKADQKYVKLFDKIPTLRQTYWMNYKQYCSLKYAS